MPLAALNMAAGFDKSQKSLDRNREKKLQIAFAHYQDKLWC
jgi:hypothetical protein